MHHSQRTDFASAIFEFVGSEWWTDERWSRGEWRTGRGGVGLQLVRRRPRHVGGSDADHRGAAGAGRARCGAAHADEALGLDEEVGCF